MKSIAGCQWAVRRHTSAIAIMAARSNLSLLGGVPLVARRLAKNQSSTGEEIGEKKAPN